MGLFRKKEIEGRTAEEGKKKIEGKTSEEWFNKGSTLYNLERYKEAIRSYDKALEINSNYESAKNNKKIAEEKLREQEELFKLGFIPEDPEIKVEYYSKELEKNPKDADAWNNKGFALSELRKYEEAIKCYNKTLEINPEHVDALCNKGLILGLLGRHTEAIGCYDNALGIKPEHEDAWIGKGGVLSELKEYEEAIKCFNEVIEKINPDSDIAWYFKGVVFHELERYSDAIKSYDWALVLNPSNEKAKNAKEVAEEKIKVKMLKEQKSKSTEIQPSEVKRETPTSLSSKIKELVEYPAKYKDLLELYEEDKNVVSELISLLNSKSDITRGKAAFALMQIADRYPDSIKNAIPTLIGLLDDESTFTRAQVAKALRKVAGRHLEWLKDALPKLIKLIEDKDLGVREDASFAIALVAEKYPELIEEFTPKLIKLLDDLNSKCISNAIYALKGIGRKSPEKSKDAIPKLVRLLDDEDSDIRIGSAQNLFILRKWKEEIMREHLEDIQRMILRLTELLDDEDEVVREDTAFAIGAIGPIYSEGVKEAIPKLIKLLDDEDAEARWAAAYTLGEVGAVEALNPLKNLLKDDMGSTGFEHPEKEESATVGMIAREAIGKIKKKTEVKIGVKVCPEIKVKFSETSFKPNIWKRFDLIISNKGNANAKEIKIEYPKERIEIEGLGEIKELKPTEEKRLEIGLRPMHSGEVPLETKIAYKDLDDKEYKEKKTFWITVGKEEKEYKKEKIEITIERAIYDPCKRDFIEGRLPRMKEWINRYDSGAYWFAISIQNNMDKTIEEWGIELEMSSALKIKEAKIEGIEIEIPHEAHLGLFEISVPKEYGIVIPKGGAQRIYFKLRAEKPKTTYEISGVFKSGIGEMPIRAKEFKYLCDTGVPPEAVKAELKKTFSEKDAARLALSFKTVQELDRMCNQDAKTEEYLDKLSVLKIYTEGFSDNFSMHVNEFSRFMKEEQSGYLDDEYKGKVRRFCTSLVDVWISEFLKG